VLRVNYAQPMKIKGGDKGFSHQAVWADADQYLDERLAEQELEAHERREAKRQGQEEEGVAEGATAMDATEVAIS
jgi:peptidyl-prolyl isomerase E (cyclophilin E)